MKAREMRLRRAAERQGMTLVRSRRRDPRAIGFGRWCLISRWGDQRVIGVVPGVGFGLVDAPAARGGAERFAAWLTLDCASALVTDPATPSAAPITPDRSLTPQLV